ncbi:MAG: hypothetical protein JXB39_01020 [Deltaproteobacteria bacterium]|nr:hypothetical protein [Deltaproteobacteria bacterium]
MDLGNLAAFGTCSLALTLSACTAQEDTGGETGTTACGVTVDKTIPENGSTDAYYRASVEFWLSDPDPEGDPTVTLSGPSGDVTGATWISDDGEIVRFQPSTPLDPSTEYASKLQYCSGDAIIGFQTSALGTPLSVDLVDRTFHLDLTTARFVEPATFGALLGMYLNVDILVGVLAADPGHTLDVIGAVTVSDSDPPVQNFCMPTIAFPQADFSEAPWFRVGPVDTPVAVVGGSVTIHGLDVQGTFASDGSTFGGGVLAGMIDARDLVGVFGEIETPEDFCALSETFEAPCEACDYDGGDGSIYCLSLVADQIVAPQLPGVTIEPVELKNCHDGCKDTSGCP